MENKRKILSMACCVGLLSACAANQQVNEAPWMISPNVKVSSPENNASGLYKLGRYYQGQRRDSQAIEAYQKAIALNHGYAEAYNGLGVIYSRQAKYEKAIEAFKAALNCSPETAHLYNNLGYAYYLQGQYAVAISSLKHATALDPANQNAFNNLGLAYAKAGSKGESEQAFVQAAKIQEESAKPAAIVATPSPQPAFVNLEPKTTSLPEVLPATVAMQKTELPESDLPKYATSKSEVQNFVMPKPEVQNSEVQNNRIPKPEVQMLTLPKNQGIVRLAAESSSVPVIDSRVKLVQVAPNVYELRTDLLGGMPLQAASVPEEVHVVHMRVEVSNGNGVTGMANKVSKFLLNQGYSMARLTNQKPFNIKKSQIQYRDGFHAEALLLKDSLPESPELIESTDLRADIDVKLLLGKDLSAQLAYFKSKQQNLRVASTIETSKNLY